MGKLGAQRAQLLLRHRPRPLLRSRSAGDRSIRSMATELFSRLTRRLVRILQDRTGDGYVFRTDLRLRPDPGSTPLAIPVEAALHYYEGRGQNWERAAMIKARPVAGDIAAGGGLPRGAAALCLAQIHGLCGDRRRPFDQAPDPCAQGPWRDRGQGPQRQARPRRHPRDRVLRPDPAADRRRPLSANCAAARPCRCWRRSPAHGWITAEARDALTRQYWFLRRVEHAIQMVADEQTHMLPEDDAGLERIAHMLGFADAEAFSDGVPRSRCSTVERHYAALFETAPRAVGRHRQPRLHRRRRRSRHAADAGEPRLRAAERHLPGHPRLAFRPLPRDAVGRGARAADRADAGAAARPSARPAAPTRR